MQWGAVQADHMAKGFPSIADVAQKQWEICWGTERHNWPFNTGCCTYKEKQVPNCKDPRVSTEVLVQTEGVHRKKISRDFKAAAVG